MVVDYITGDITELSLNPEKCIRVIELLANTLTEHDEDINTRELICILGGLLQAAGISIEENEDMSRTHVWKQYKDKGTLGYALQLSGLDMLEHWAQVQVENSPEEN